MLDCQYHARIYGRAVPGESKTYSCNGPEYTAKVAIGCTTLDALEMYEDYVSAIIPNRPLFWFMAGNHSKTEKNYRPIRPDDGRDIGLHTTSTQKFGQYPFLRRHNPRIPPVEHSPHGAVLFSLHTLGFRAEKRVHFVTYDESIEQNLLALVTTKERLNEFIKLGEIREESEIFEEFDLTPSLIENC